MSSARRPIRYPRKVTRAFKGLLKYALLAVLVAFLSRRFQPPWDDLRQDPAAPVDFAWGSVLHRFQNHPTSPTPRAAFPWTTLPAPPTRAVPRVALVTFELAGLHRNGGIGTAYLELATALARSETVNVTIIVAHLASTFSSYEREAVETSLERDNIRLEFVEEEVRPFYPGGWTPLASIRVYHYLRARDGAFDIVHFPENSGIGYFSTLAKFEGLILRDASIVVGLHGAEVEWAAMLGKRYPSEQYAVNQGFFERRSAELADVVISPSEYMLEYVRLRGWKLPPSTYVIPNIVSTSELHPTSLDPDPPATNSSLITEIVFFGRLEERKGVRLFVEALELLFAVDSPYPIGDVNKITFLGRDTINDASRTDTSTLVESALDALLAHSKVAFEYQFLKEYERDDAISYLQHPNRLAVLPSLSDNSPSTVLECIVYSIRFLATNVGGVPELVHEGDRGRVLFPPLPRDFAAKLSETIVDDSTVSKPIRRAAATSTAQDDWVGLHGWIASLPAPPLPPSLAPLVSIVVTHYERPRLIPHLLDSLLAQTYTNYEVILVDDGSTSQAAVFALLQLQQKYFAPSPDWRLLRINNSYLGEARNRGAALGRGSYFLFLDDDDVLKPHALQTLVDVVSRTGASALSTWLDEFAGDMDPRTAVHPLPHRRSYWFLGQSVTSGMVSNTFGSGNIFVSRNAFEGIGGFTTYREVGGEDWEFYMRLALAGHSQYVVPEELIHVRSDPAGSSMKFAMDPWDASFHALIPLLSDRRVQELDLAHGLMLAKSSLTRRGPPSAAFADSVADYQLLQGWNGWSYSFEPVGSIPSTDTSFLAVVAHDQWSTEKSRFSPYITDTSQTTLVTAKGVGLAPVRTYRSPRAMDVSLHLTYSSAHQCGDGTHLRLFYRPSPGEFPEELFSRNTMRRSSDSFKEDLSLVVGSTIYLVTEPLASDNCDLVDVRLTLTPTVKGNQAWSKVAKAQSRKAAASAPIEPAKSSDEQWVAVLPPPEAPTFHIALIFDKNRFDFAKQVVRSADHFIASRALHFHIVAPIPLHAEIYEFFRDIPAVVQLYDHSLCYYFARQVLAFSNPDIHISAHCKIFLSEIITMTTRVLYLDTDVTIFGDISTCYGESDLPSTLFTMGIDMGDSCQQSPDDCWPIGLHWRVPEGLTCGNIEVKDPRTLTPRSCAAAGELETVQVNGGVAMMELTRMRDTGFVARYVQSVVHHYRIVGKTAVWGEQDFLNSYFRLFPAHVELLPCGCNYQWSGSRKEVKCGEQPTFIGHAWSHSVASRTTDPYNSIFHHFLDNATAEEVPILPPLSLSAAGSPNTSLSVPESNANCPRQSHDCAVPFKATEYGQLVMILSRFRESPFAADLVDSIESQSYPAIAHKAAVPEGITLPLTKVYREEVPIVGLNATEDYLFLCEQAGHLVDEEMACNVPPGEPQRRAAYFERACRAYDSSATSMFDLDAIATHTGWILYLDDDKLFMASDSLALLMAEINSPSELIVFRSYTHNQAEAWDYKKKLLPRTDFGAIGFAFHSSSIELTAWRDTRCEGMMATFENLSKTLSMRWVEVIPTVEHPLQRHLPRYAAEDFRVTIVVFETQGRVSWSAHLIEMLQHPELSTLVAEIIVASVDSEEGTFGADVRVVNLSAGSGLVEIAALVNTEGVLLMSDDIQLDKPALTAMIGFWLDDRLRIVGPFVEASHDEFPAPLSTNEAYPDDGDALLDGLHEYSQILPRVLLTSNQHLTVLTSFAQEVTLHPICHGLLLNAIASDTTGLPPFRVLPPPNSIVDRIHDCRVRSWFDVVPGVHSGDDMSGETPPSFAQCYMDVTALMGEGFEWPQRLGELGQAGEHGMMIGSGTVQLKGWWETVRRREKCLKV